MSDNKKLTGTLIPKDNKKAKMSATFYSDEPIGSGGDSEIFNEHIDATDTQRNTALANVSNQTANTATGKMGYKVLDPTKTFAEQVTAENTIYEIRDVFDLGGTQETPVSVTLPVNSTLKFNGGKLKNGTINGNYITIIGEYGILEGVSGTITNSIGIVHTYWFGYTTSSIKQAIDMFEAANIVIDSGTYTHTETVVVPYDTTITSENVKITTDIANTPIFDLYIQMNPIDLSKCKIIVSNELETTAVVFHGNGHSSIRGYNNAIGQSTNINVMMPFVYCNYLNTHVTAFELPDNNNGSLVYYMYFKNIYISAQGCKEVLHISGSLGTTNTAFYVTSWHNSIAVHVKNGLGCRFYIDYQCNQWIYPNKVYKDDNYENNTSGGWISVAIHDAHVLNGSTHPEQYYEMIDNSAKMYITSPLYFSYDCRKNCRRTNALISRSDYEGTNQNSEQEVYNGYITFSNYTDIYTRTGLYLANSHEDAIIKLINYFNSINPTRSVRIELNLGDDLITNYYRKAFSRLIDYTDALSSITNNTKVTIDLIIPWWAPNKLIKTVLIQSYDLNTSCRRTLNYKVNYTNNNITHLSLDNSCVNYGRTQLSIDDIKYDCVKFVEDICTIDNVNYKVIAGSRPTLYFAFNGLPSSGDTWTYSMFGLTGTITFNETPTREELHDILYKELFLKLPGILINLNGYNSNTVFFYVGQNKNYKYNAGYVPSTLIDVKNQNNTSVLSARSVLTDGNVNQLIPIQVLLYGDASSRPTSPYIGEQYFDTSLLPARYICYNGTDWVNLDGMALS